MSFKSHLKLSTYKYLLRFCRTICLRTSFIKLCISLSSCITAFSYNTVLFQLILVNETINQTYNKISLLISIQFCAKKEEFTNKKQKKNSRVVAHV